MQGGHLPLEAGSLFHTSPGGVVFGQMEITVVGLLFRKANHNHTQDISDISIQGEQISEMPFESEGNSRCASDLLGLQLVLCGQLLISQLCFVVRPSLRNHQALHIMSFEEPFILLIFMEKITKISM